MSALKRASQAVSETERLLADAKAANAVAEHLLALSASRGGYPRLRRRIAIALNAGREACDQAERARQRAIAELADYADAAGGGA